MNVTKDNKGNIGENPFKTMKVYICKYGHAFPVPCSPYCPYYWESGKKTNLLEANITNIKKIKFPLNIIGKR